MTGVSSRLAAALEGRYRIEHPLGEGGMATVYLADDVRHERKVALKVLRPELAAVIGAERFLAEIKTTANLQHPHILPLFDSGEADSFLYYVMPYVAGETLRDRLDRERQLGVDEAVRIARDVADALDYAHRHGVIHRDIKPANVLLHDGRPVVADFGIALALSAAGGGRMTETGLSLGTPHYMSPEQASADRDLSPRSDVYSLGCVLYEMLAGQPPHTGPTSQNVLVRILTEDPRPVTDLRRSVAPNLAAVVARSIEKLPADRFESARAFLDALDDPTYDYVPAPRRSGAVPSGVAAAATGRSASWDLRSRALAAAVVVLAGLSLWLALPGGEPDPPPAVAFAVETESGSGPFAFSRVDVSVRGDVAYSSLNNLFVRPPGALESSLLREDILGGFSFSPDGEWIAFLSRDVVRGSRVASGTSPTVSLMKLPVRGGPAVTLVQSSGLLAWPRWGEDGFVYAARRSEDGAANIVRVPEIGGELTVIGFEPREWFPVVSDVLPDGAGLLVSPAVAGPGRGAAEVLLVDPSTGESVLLISDGGGARWMPSGHLVYEHESGSLWAAPFDLRRRRVTGPAVPVVEGVATTPNLGGAFALSRSGVLAYVQGEAFIARAGGGSVHFELRGTDGSVEEIPVAPSDHWDARISPDGSRMVYTRNDDLWVIELDLGNHDSITAGGTGQHNPVWSPDGRRVAYAGADGAVWIRPWDRSEEPVRTRPVDRAAEPSQWLADGRILFSTGGPGDVFAVTAESDAEPEALLKADWREGGAQVSPDGRWIAYVSHRGDDPHVAVRSWPDLTGEVRVSEEGVTAVFSGTDIAWDPDGRTLYYRMRPEDGESTLVAARYETSGGFRIVSREPVGIPQAGIFQDLAPDGRFLFAVLESRASTSQPRRLVAVANWFTALEERLGEGN